VDVVEGALAGDAAEEDWLQEGADVLVEVLDEERVAEYEAVLDVFGEGVAGLGGDGEVVGLLEALDPGVGLVLRVEHERPAFGVEGDESGLEGEVVGRKACGCPVTRSVKENFNNAFKMILSFLNFNQPNKIIVS